VAGSENFLVASDFRGREIQSEGGTLLGTVNDVLLDEEANVTGFSLNKIYVQGPLAERKAIARSAITNFGSKESPMTTLLAKAESISLPTI
jgi:sporulation protein YlmC with PRC-barrel domain